MKKNMQRFPVEMMSKALGVSRSGYYKWLKNKDVKPIHAEIDKEIRKEFEKSRGRYGSPRIYARLCLTVAQRSVSRSTVARRMKAMKLVARPRRKYVVTTDSRHEYRISENLLDRKFDREEVNQVWVGDITYIRTDKGWRYLTTVIDLADRSIVGWALSETMHTECTTIAALKKALKNRYIGKKSGLMFHSDRGIQYACDEFRALLKEYQIVQSMSRKGNCWDNAVAESFFKTIKTEELDQYTVIKAENLYSLIFRYIEGWYNTLRIHSALNGKTPAEIFNEKRFKQAA
jgi:transposase InsO family protein